MGYDVHITRAEHYWDSKQQPILESEWLAVVHADPTLEVDTLSYSDRRTEGGAIERQHPVAWLGHPDQTPTNPSFWYEDGEISRKRVDDPIIKKMIEIARKLDARVVGDDGEEYDEVDGKILVHDWAEPTAGFSSEAPPP